MAKSLRGFASMPPDMQREIASLGGKTAHMKGTAHEFNSETARLAGLKGLERRRVNEAARKAQKAKNAA